MPTTKEAALAKINHLRCSGSSLYHTSSYVHLAGSEAKANPHPIVDNAVVEAFGVGKCPRLVRLLSDDDVGVLVHTLKCLTGVLNNPRDVVACLDENHSILDPLSKLLYHGNAEIQQLAAACLHLIASHANGRAALIAKRTMRKIMKAFARTDEVVVQNLLDTALHVSTILAGAQEMTQNSYVPIILDKLKQEPLSDAVVLRTLRLLKAFVNDAMSGTVLRIVEAGGVEMVSRFVFSKSKTVS
ncbi:hypothetical protein DYB37_010429 [Aphanomyces astaci]|uniref:Armadillo repeat-containing domain-containing protein n=1 Tax=Aphanomyces astaci TaxID=112090 RepID=A0A3R7B7E6_APHAT|nr:hypothetical protein DYB35_011963 [Aphanomyces astaci]RHZ12152.1 hypothetical protein DYB37_010429 [Aphanomyces astaci]